MWFVVSKTWTIYILELIKVFTNVFKRKKCDKYKIRKSSLQGAQLTMHNVLQNDAEYIMQLAALSSSLNVRLFSFFLNFYFFLHFSSEWPTANCFRITIRVVSPSWKTWSNSWSEFRPVSTNQKHTIHLPWVKKYVCKYANTTANTNHICHAMIQHEGEEIHL